MGFIMRKHMFPQRLMSIPKDKKNMKRKHPVLKFALTLGAVIAVVAMTTFVMISDLPPAMQNRADIQGLFILGDAFFVLVAGSIIWALFKLQDRRFSDDRWYSQRRHLVKNEKVD